MISFEDLMAKYNGRFIDFDGAYGSQCMDLEHVYISEVLGQADPRILAADVARNVYLNFDTIFGHELFTKIPNSPTAVPAKGDIMFWDKPYGPYYIGTTLKYAGHVGINTTSDINIIRAYEQNNPTGSPCHIQEHRDNYAGCLGWLRYKGPAPTDYKTLYEKELAHSNDLQSKIDRAIIDLQ